MRAITLALLAFSAPAFGQWPGYCRPEPPKTVFVERNSYCATTEHNLEFTAQPEYPPVLIKWNVVKEEEIPLLCNNLRAVACAHVNETNRGRECTITTAKHLNLAILGHEVRHCYELGWHR